MESKLDRTRDEIYQLDEIATDAILYRMEVHAEQEAKERKFTRAEALTYLKTTPPTIKKAVSELEIDTARHEGWDWCITLEEIYAIRDLLRKSPRTATLAPLTRRKGHSAHIISITNQKGGVGKTSLAVNLAAAMGIENHLGLRIGLIDGDPQATLTMYLDNKDPNADDISLRDIIFGKYKLAEGETRKDLISRAFKQTRYPNIRILSASQNDRSIETSFHKAAFQGSEMNPYSQVAEILEEVKDEFDIIIIDTPPATNYAVSNFLYASDSVIIPVAPTENDRDATLSWLRQLPDTFETLCHFGFKGYELPIKMVVTLFDVKSKAHAEIKDSLSDLFVDFIAGETFNESEGVRTCANHMTPVSGISKSQYARPTGKATYNSAHTNINILASSILTEIKKLWVRKARNAEGSQG